MNKKLLVLLLLVIFFFTACAKPTQKKLKNPNFLDWISKNENYYLGDLKEEDEYVYNSTNIKKWSAMYDEWDKIEEPYLIEQIAYNEFGYYNEKVLKNSQGIVAKKIITRNRYNPMQISGEGLAYSDDTTILYIDFTGEFEGLENVSREIMWLCLDKRGNIIKKDGEPILLKPFPAKQKTSSKTSYNGAFISKKVIKIYPCENCSTISGIEDLRFVW